MSEIRVNNVIGEDGATPVNFSKGINITSGVVTATTFKGTFEGAATGLSGTPDITTGVITVSDSTASTSVSTGAVIVSGGVGIAKSLYVGGNISAAGTVTYEDVTNVDSVGIVTAGAGLKVTAGGANIVGITTSSVTALDAISEQLVRVDGNTATITYSSGGANIGYCTNPTGDITLSVTGIPTTGFDNQALTFSMIVNNAGANTAAGVRTCNAVKLNNVTKTIRWSGGSVGTGNTSSYDIFNFTGINTIGSGSTTANYEVLGLVNGDFRLY
jgi:hypothetical protein